MEALRAKLKERRGTLEKLDKKIAAYQDGAAGRTAKVNTSAERLQKARIAVHTAAATPGDADDRAAAAAVKATQAEHDAAVLERDAADREFQEALEPARAQLVAEIGALEGQLVTTRITLARADLTKRVTEMHAPRVAEAIVDIVALEAVSGNFAVLPGDNLLNVLAAAACVNLQRLVEQGKARAQALRAGKEEA